MKREKVAKLLSDVGASLLARGVLSRLDMYGGHDIHAFLYSSRDPRKVVHVQGYPGMSSDDEAKVYATMMDAEKLARIRESDEFTSIGNEHRAIIGRFPSFEKEMPLGVPYDPVYLQDILARDVPELAS